MTANLIAGSRSSSGYFLGAAMTPILTCDESLHQTRARHRLESVVSRRRPNRQESVRWLSLDEFVQGEQRNPFPPDCPAQPRRVRALPPPNLRLWLWGTALIVVDAYRRRRQAVVGVVWVPSRLVNREGRYKRALTALCAAVLASAILDTLGWNIGKLLVGPSLVLALLVAAAFRQVRVGADLDLVAGLVGVDSVSIE